MFDAGQVKHARGESGNAYTEARKSSNNDATFAANLVDLVRGGSTLEEGTLLLSKGKLTFASAIKKAYPPESWGDAQYVVQVLIDGGVWGSLPIPPGNAPAPSSGIKKWAMIGGGIVGGLLILKKLAK